MLKTWIIRLGAISLALGVMACSSSKQEETAVPAEAAVSAAVSPYAEALELFNAHRYYDCIEAATKVLEANGPTVEGLTIRGIANAKFNKPYPAFKDLLEASKLDYSADTLVNLGNALRSFGFCARAIDAYEHALALDPNNPYILINMTSSYLCMEDVDLANTTFQKAFPNLPKDAIAFTNAAILKDLDNSPEEALKAAKVALIYDPSYRPAYKVLTRALYATGDSAGAQEATKQYNQLKGATMRSVRIPRKPRTAE